MTAAGLASASRRLVASTWMAGPVQACARHGELQRMHDRTEALDVVREQLDAHDQPSYGDG
ncbi:hypothetical protein COW64_24215 [bacterium (Candidatus Blackallbacteria) CG18_big_fil_WC_8_21_14_2_50_49_26]|nr:MAG: hypothetical protein COW64_24215 [bacterium (Candidatus Blackallbacteria) CG18_big_fil_WC_8_21_14_2_50_49_26]